MPVFASLVMLLATIFASVVTLLLITGLKLTFSCKNEEHKT